LKKEDANFFKNKVVWITGASSGIGEAMAIACAQQGAKLVLSARREDELLRVARACNVTTERILILPFDLTSISEFEHYTNKVIQYFGEIHFLFNNGGFSQRSEAVSTPSIAGKFGFYLRSSYSAAKHALHGFYESLRLENEKKGIRVTIVCPGKIKTNISLNALTKDGSKHNRMDESHEQAMSAEECAKQIIKAVIYNKEEVLIGGKELKAVALKRFFPRLFSRIIRKQSPY